jgi:hypothetical protein
MSTADECGTSRRFTRRQSDAPARDSPRAPPDLRAGAPRQILSDRSASYTAAALALQQGTPPHVVAAMLGHASVATTLRFYAHVTHASTPQLTRSTLATVPPRGDFGSGVGRLEGRAEGQDFGNPLCTKGLRVPRKGIEPSQACSERSEEAPSELEGAARKRHMRP